MTPARLRAQFAARFGGAPALHRAPGRVNLIGEHTDYNGGFVLPAAIDFDTRVAIGAGAGRGLRVHSCNFDQTVRIGREQFAVDAAPNQPGAASWSVYVVAVARALTAAGVQIPDADLMIDGEVPVGAGLSSSAALELALAHALAEAAGARLEPAALALLCQRAENETVGTRCGIMDQYAAALSRAGHAMLLDCRSLQHRELPLDARLRVAGARGGVKIVICNTMVRHSHAGGEYNRRREECERGVAALARGAPAVASLRDVDEDFLVSQRTALDEVAFRRCRHVILENARVLAAADALEQGDLDQFGALMHESHRSLRQDYEVSCPELDLMVELAGSVEGVYGARMTGGGFGGCTVNLVREDAVERFSEAVGGSYRRATGRTPDIYVCETADGAARIDAV